MTHLFLWESDPRCAPGGLHAVGVPAGAGDCGDALRRRGDVSLPQDRQDESGRDAEE